MRVYSRFQLYHLKKKKTSIIIRKRRYLAYMKMNIKRIYIFF